MRILLLTLSPISFTNLRNKLDISDWGLAKDLKDLQKKGLIRKEDTHLWSISDKGIAQLKKSVTDIRTQACEIEAQLGGTGEEQRIIQACTRADSEGGILSG